MYGSTEQLLGERGARRGWYVLLVAAVVVVFAMRIARNAGRV